MSDCAALLWRLRAYGHAVPSDLWDEAEAYATAHFPKTSLPFVEMHMALLAAATHNTAALDELQRQPGEGGKKQRVQQQIERRREGAGTHDRTCRDREH